MTWIPCMHSWTRVIPLLPWHKVHDKCVFCGIRRSATRPGTTGGDQ